MLVAAIGLYGLLAFNVAQRRWELGIRAALGAAPARLVGMVFGEALGLVTTGVALGLAVALVAAPRLEPLLFHVSPHDPLVAGGVALTLLLTAVLSAVVPARRATQVDPASALRTD